MISHRQLRHSLLRGQMARQIGEGVGHLPGVPGQNHEAVVLFDDPRHGLVHRLGHAQRFLCVRASVEAGQLSRFDALRLLRLVGQPQTRLRAFDHQERDLVVARGASLANAPEIRRRKQLSTLIYPLTEEGKGTPSGSGTPARASALALPNFSRDLEVPPAE